MLSVKYSNGQSFTGEFPPGATIWAPVEGVVVENVEVRVEGKVLFTLAKHDLELLQSSLAPETRVMWDISENGISATTAPE